MKWQAKNLNKLKPVVQYTGRHAQHALKTDQTTKNSESCGSIFSKTWKESPATWLQETHFCRSLMQRAWSAHAIRRLFNCLSTSSSRQKGVSSSCHWSWVSGADSHSLETATESSHSSAATSWKLSGVSSLPQAPINSHKRHVVKTWWRWQCQFENFNKNNFKLVISNY